MKRLLYLLTCITALSLTSCTRDSFICNADFSKRNANVLRLSVEVEGICAEVATRATVAPEPDEAKINSLYMLFFQPDDYRNGAFVDYVEVNLPTGSSMNVETNIDVSGTSLNAGQAYNILAVANIADNRYLNKDIELWIAQWSHKTESQTMAEALALTKGDDSITSGLLLMNGRFEKEANQNHVKLLLTRNLVRFDALVREDVRDEYDLVSVSIWNAYPSSSVWGEGIMDYSNNAQRISRFYGIDNENIVNGDKMGDIIGGLYAFENYVAAPAKNDRLTTCLIIGLRKRSGASGNVTYYRANVNSEGSRQALKRNNAYRLTITNVNGTGQPTEELAYTGKGNTLDYIVNEWTLDDNGLIVQDQYSILSIPAKTIRIGREGGESSYSIFISSKAINNPVLLIKNQTYDKEGITASLSGNILNVNASPLALSETERRGVITLHYAGLEISMNIIQSGEAETYLNVYLPEGGIPRFSAFAGGVSGLIRVEASDSWTAKLYMDGFSFNSAHHPAPAVTTITDSSGDVVGNLFRIYAHSANDKLLIRRAFVVVTLDGDPENYSAVIQVSQDAGLGINISPMLNSVTFDGAGYLKNNPNATNVMFDVFPNESQIDDVFEDWFYKLIPTGGYNDVGYFSVINYNNNTPSETNNTIGVTTIGANTSGRNYKATLRLYQTDDENVYTDITLVQEYIPLTLTPNVFSTIPVVGGETGLITVNTDPALKWSAAVVTNGTANGRSLVKHEAILLSDLGDTIKPGTLYSTTTKFLVKFPKVYYPNRDIPVSATVTVTVGGLTANLTVNQTMLTANPMIGYGMTGSPDYGGLGDTYNRGWDGEGANNGGYGLAQIPGYARSGVGDMNVAGIASNVTYLHIVAHMNSGAGGNTYNWSVINNFINNRDAWTVISLQAGSSYTNAVNNANSPLKQAGYPDVISSSYSGDVQIHQASSGTKLYKFLMENGNSPLTPSMITSAFYNDGIYTTIQTSGLPASAVVILSKANNADRAQLVIDMKNKFLYIGESQLFWYDNYLSNNRGVFLNNLMYFIGNASKYGSHFTDMLRDDLNVPAPWDTGYWGANAGVPSK